MNPRDEDKVTKQEFRQHCAWANWWLGQKRLAQRRRVLANTQRKIELGVRDEDNKQT